jgi:hypothetical protein
VALLDDWADSRGARIEVRLARDVGIPAMLLDRWTANKNAPQDEA